MHLTIRRVFICNKIKALVKDLCLCLNAKNQLNCKNWQIIRVYFGSVGMRRYVPLQIAVIISHMISDFLLLLSTNSKLLSSFNRQPSAQKHSSLLSLRVNTVFKKTRKISYHQTRNTFTEKTYNDSFKCLTADSVPLTFANWHTLTHFLGSTMAHENIIT